MSYHFSKVQFPEELDPEEERDAASDRLCSGSHRDKRLQSETHTGLTHEETSDRFTEERGSFLIWGKTHAVSLHYSTSKTRERRTIIRHSTTNLVLDTTSGQDLFLSEVK